MPTYQQDGSPTVQNCSSCPPTWHPIEQQDPRHFSLIASSQKNTTAPHLDQDQGVDSHETAMIVPDHTRAQFVPLQTAMSQDNLDYASVHERAAPPPNMGLPRAPTLDALIAESWRLLAGRYLNNPDAHVCTIRLEPGPSGQCQVVITLEMPNVL
ncbi:hypothetical protein H4582DRAFT_2058547 [Lactarius indigo]|nr:hypothetical protein H4582DRAFT_2058547 [Lactarius indigo]